MAKKKKYTSIEDYGLIGNLNTTALVSKDGSIDFLPFTRFDSPTLFGAILDKDKGGYFSIAVKDTEANHKQLYLPDTAILLTRYLTNDGIAELTDFMPVMEEGTQLAVVRKLKIIKGEHTFRIELNPRFNFGRNDFITEIDNNKIIIRNKTKKKQAFCLISNVEFKNDKDKLHADVRLKTKDEIKMVMISAEESGNFENIKSLKYYTEKSFEKTVRFWRDWVGKSTYKGRWQDVVNRSAITLKLLTSFQYGSTVAAATLGLPEQIGGERNWDYRFTWIRDAAFTMYSFLQLGYTDEARKFIGWIKERSNEIKSARELKLMYRIDGSSDLKEVKLKNLEGYKGSAPVRIGNGAFNQFQLDIYGELVDTIYIYNKNAEPISYEFWLGLMKFIDFVCENWKEKDRGIWEVRDDQREFLISKVMSWVALDRGILIAEDRSFPAPLERWRKT